TTATRNSTFIDATTPARPIANTASARKTAVAAPAAQIGMVKVPVAASTSSMFPTFRVRPAPHPALPRKQERAGWGAVHGSEPVYPSRPATAANHRCINLGRLTDSSTETSGPWD